MANKIEFKIFADSKDLEKGLDGVKRKFDSLGRSSALAFGGITASIFALTKAADGERKAIAGVEQAIKSTSGAAGRSLQKLKEDAKALQKETLFGDDVILRNATQQLLTFTNIAKEEFDRTQRVALDVATVLDTTGDGTARLKDVSIQLGKALNDPVKNLSALSRAGIQFSDDQIKIIKNLVETNRLSEAQSVILSELERQYGGQARAARAADSGLGSLKNAIGDVAEKIGEALLPTVKDLTGRMERLANFLETHPGFASASAKFLILGLTITGVTTAIGFLGSALIRTTTSILAMNAALGLSQFRAFGLLTEISILHKNVGLLNTSLLTLSGVAIAAFAGWNIGRLIGEVTGLDKAIQDLLFRLDIFSGKTNEEILRNAEAANAVAVLKKKMRDQELAAEQEHQNNIITVQQEADLLKLENLALFQEQVGILSEFQLQELLTRLNAEVDATKSAEEQKSKILQDEINKREKLRQLEKKTVIDAFSTLSNAFNVFLKDSKANAIAQKILSVGKAIVNTALGVTQALALGPPGIPIARVIGALGAIEVATIAATSFAVGSPEIPRDMTASIHKGEMIIPTTFSDAIRRGDLTLSGSGAGSSGGGVMFDFSGATLNGVNESFVREIFTKASEDIRSRILAPLPVV